MLFWIQKKHTQLTNNQLGWDTNQLSFQLVLVILVEMIISIYFNLEQNIENIWDHQLVISEEKSATQPVVGAWGWGDWSPATVRIMYALFIYSYLINRY